MPDCAECGDSLELQEAGALFYCPSCDDEIGVEDRDRIVDVAE